MHSIGLRVHGNAGSKPSACPTKDKQRSTLGPLVDRGTPYHNATLACRTNLCVLNWWPMDTISCQHIVVDLQINSNMFEK